MPAAVADFVTASDLTDYRAGDPDTLLRQAQAAIRRYCGWHIAPEVTETITLDGSGSRSLWLPSLYVTDIASVTVEGIVKDVDDYDWSTNGYVSSRFGTWSIRPRQIVVEFTHGYDDIPDDLIGVAVAMAGRAAASPAGPKRQTVGPFSVEWDSPGPLQHERDILDQYKLPPRP